jgi:phosphatidylglycerophosphatase A
MSLNRLYILGRLYYIGRRNADVVRGRWKTLFSVKPAFFDFPYKGCGMSDKFIRILATGFGSGLAPLAPGTAGTVVGIPLYLLFSSLFWPLHLLSIIALSFLAIFVAQEAEAIFGEKDPSRVVIDEIVGFQFTMFLVAPTVVHILAGFLLFRIFDIVKPFPIRLSETKLPGGYGVVGDDIIAGIYGGIVLQILIALTGM